MAKGLRRKSLPPDSNPRTTSSVADRAVRNSTGASHPSLRNARTKA
jgi:hypothetical protein